MFKKIFMPVVLALFSVATFAQDAKIAYVNYQEVLMLMPEISNVEKTIANMSEENQKGLAMMQQEIQAEYQKYEAEKATMTDAIRKIKEEDIMTRQQRLQTAAQTMEQSIRTEQQRLLTPIEEKLQKAIETVAADKGVMYVIEGTVMHYKSPKALDLTPLVKKHLGILQ